MSKVKFNISRYLEDESTTPTRSSWKTETKAKTRTAEEKSQTNIRDKIRELEQQKNNERNIAADILLDLGEKLHELKQVFFEADPRSSKDNPKMRSKPMYLPEFVKVMRSMLPKRRGMSDDELVARLCEIFHEIDFNGDDRVEWEEFNSFLIDAALVQHFSLEKIKPYQLSQIQHEAALEESVKKICCFKNWDKMVLCGRVKKCKIINAYDLSTVHVLPDHDGAVLNAEYISDWNCLVTSSADLALRFWDMSYQKEEEKKYQCIRVIRDNPAAMAPSSPGSPTNKSSSPDPESGPDSSGGSGVGAGGSSGGVMANLESQMSMKWSSKHKALFTASRTGDVLIWQGADVQSLSVVHTWKAHDDAIMDMLELPRENLLVTASLDKKICLYNLESLDLEPITKEASSKSGFNYQPTFREKNRRMKPPTKLEGHAKGVFSVSYCQDYHFLLSAGFEHEAFVWVPNAQPHPFRLTDTRKPHQSSLIGVVAVPDTSQVITADSKGMVKIWDIRNFQCVQTFFVETNMTKQQYNSFQLNAFAYQPIGQRIICSGRKIYAFDYETTGSPLVADDHPLQAALYNDVTMSFISAAERDIKIWDSREGTITQILNDVASTEITALCLDPRGRKFFYGTHSGEIKCHNFNNGTAFKSFPSHGGEVTALVYVKKRKLIVSASWDRTLRLLSDRDPKENIIKEMIGHENDVKCCDKSNSLNLIASGDASGTVMIWDFDYSKPLKALSHVDGSSGHSDEVTCVLFLYKYPALLSADASGNIVLRTTRPHPFPFHTLLTFSNQPPMPPPPPPIDITSTPIIRSPTPSSAGGERSRPPSLVPTPTSATTPGGSGSGSAPRLSTPPAVVEEETMGPKRDYKKRAVNCMAYDRHSFRLFCADDVGNITVFNMSRVIEKAKFEASHWPIRYSASDLATVTIPQLPSLEPSDVEFVQRWQAHEDSIRSLQFIKDPPCLLSASADCRVCLWSLEGRPLGSLQQAPPSIFRGAHHPPAAGASTQPSTTSPSPDVTSPPTRESPIGDEKERAGSPGGAELGGGLLSESSFEFTGPSIFEEGGVQYKFPVDLDARMKHEKEKVESVIKQMNMMTVVGMMRGNAQRKRAERAERATTPSQIFKLTESDSPSGTSPTFPPTKIKTTGLRRSSSVGRSPVSSSRELPTGKSDGSSGSQQPLSKSMERNGSAGDLKLPAINSSFHVARKT